MKPKFLFIVAFAVALVTGSCSKEHNTTTTQDNTVHLKNNAYLPVSLQVNRGMTVTWINDDNDVHTVTLDNGAFDSGDMMFHATATFTFNDVGTYTYHCTHHAGMNGTIVVVPVR